MTDKRKKPNFMNHFVIPVLATIVLALVIQLQSVLSDTKAELAALKKSCEVVAIVQIPTESMTASVAIALTNKYLQEHPAHEPWDRP